jgi:acetyltransferase
MPGAHGNGPVKRREGGMSLERILQAESVAVIGASKTATKRGYQAIRTLLDEGYEGRIYPVNPREKRILGFPCYPSVSAIDGEVDLALVTTPARTLPAILQECGSKGIQGAVIIAGGFGERDAAGKQLEDQVVAAARQWGIRLVGPNTSGIMNLHSHLNLVGLKQAPPGEIALVSQSGNMALTLITEARVKSRKGFSYYVGVGNEADIKFHEYLAFFQNDPATRAILMYVEGMREGRKFLEQAYRTSLVKPIVMLKSGRTATGKRSAGSHTGALAGMSRVAMGAFRRAGIVMIEQSDELFPVAETLSSLPPIKNNSVAILADGGGHATIAADLLSDQAIELPRLGDKTREKLKAILPDAATVTNPVDVAGGTDDDPSLFADCARIILKDPAVGGLLLVGLFGGYGIRFAESLSLKEEDAAHQMGKIVQKGGKPIVVHSLYNSLRPHSLELLRYYNITVYDSLEVACRCIGSLAQYGRYLKSYHAKASFELQWEKKAHAEGRGLIGAARSEHRNHLLEHEGKRLLQLHGAPVSRDSLARSPEDAVTIARNIGGPVVLKIVSPDILHKSDAGGVRVNIRGDDAVRATYEEILANVQRYQPGADVRGVLVSPMAMAGMEVIIGTKYDDQFGPIAMFGLGGVLVEILKDVSFRVLPITNSSARHMMEEIKSFPILDGARGMAPYDQKALRKLLTTCSEVMEAYPDIREMDLNPVIVYHEGINVVDARIILHGAGEATHR